MFEIIYQYFYLIFIAPLGWLIKRHIDYSAKVVENQARITANHNRLELHDKKFFKVCSDLEELNKNLSELNGIMKEHLRIK